MRVMLSLAPIAGLKLLLPGSTAGGKKRQQVCLIIFQVFCNGCLFFKHYVKVSQQIWGTLLCIFTQCLGGVQGLSDIDF